MYSDAGLGNVLITDVGVDASQNIDSFLPFAISIVFTRSTRGLSRVLTLFMMALMTIISQTMNLGSDK